MRNDNAVALGAADGDERLVEFVGDFFRLREMDNQLGHNGENLWIRRAKGKSGINL
jgi:hypothetical protein